MKTIYYVSLDDGVDVFFNARGKLLYYWWKNDAKYRTEYMDPLFRSLGIVVKQVNEDDKKLGESIKNFIKVHLS